METAPNVASCFNPSAPSVGSLIVRAVSLRISIPSIRPELFCRPQALNGQNCLSWIGLNGTGRAMDEKTA